MSDRVPGRISTASAAATGVGLVVFAAGLGFGRADVALIGMVLLVAVGAALAGGSRAPEVELRIEEERPGPGEVASGTRVRVEVDAPGAETVRIASTVLGFRSIPLLVVSPASLVYRMPVRHSGRQQLVAIGAQAIAADASRVGEASPERELRVRVPPRAVPLPYLPLPLTLGGRTGNHDARRPGDGGEFHDIHPFAPGDRLRRIDWKATARLGRAPGDLYVRRTLATADADIALVLDDRDDVAGSPGTWSAGDRSLTAPTSLDIAREAAWSLAAAYLDAADHVSFQAVTHSGGDLIRGSGVRQRHALRTAITAVEGGSPLARVGAPRVPRGSLVVLLSTCLDDSAVALVARWRGTGHRVLTIDTLPRARSQRVRREALVAQRVVLAERAHRLRMIRSLGADVLRWDAPDGERRAALRALARPRRRG